MSRRAHADEEGDDLEVIDLDTPGAIERPPPFERYRIDADGGGIETEDGRRARSWYRRRWVIVVAVVAVIAAAGGAYASTRNGKPARDVELNVPTTSRGGGTASADRIAAPIVIGSTVRSLLTGPIVVAGDDGARLVSRRDATATQVAGIDPGGRVIDRNGQVVLVEHDEQLSIIDLTGRRPTVTRENVTIFPAVTLNEFWIMDGETLSAAYGAKTYHLPRAEHAVAQVDGGFLVRSPAARLGVWDPNTGNTRRLPGTFDDIVATRPDRIAWIGTDCGQLQCPIHLTDIASGADAVIGSPFPPADAAAGRANGTIGRFSPDGRYLATVTPLRNGSSGGVALVDVAGGTARRLITLFAGGAPVSSAALPFDWTPDGKALLAVERGDTGTSARLARIDPATGDPRLSGDALPAVDAVVSIGVPAATKPSPLLPAPHPLLGAPSGTTIVNVAGNVIERLDLDTGRMTTETLGPAPNDVPGGNNALAPSLIPMRDGAILTNLFGAFWIPRTGIVRVLDNNSADTAIAASRDHAWIVKPSDPGRSQDVQLIPVDGTTGATGTPIDVFAQPAGAVSRGFLDFVAPRIDAPGYVDIWDPGTRSHDRIDTQIMGWATTTVLGAGDRIVWSTECQDVQQQANCGLQTLDVVTGATRVLGDWTTRGISLAPDGSAVIFNPISGDGAGSLQYVDLATGTRTPLPQASTYGSTVWGPNGWVFYNADDIDGLAAWRPGMVAPIALNGVSSSLPVAAAF
jgi:hypothetical protein